MHLPGGSEDHAPSWYQPRDTEWIAMVGPDHCVNARHVIINFATCTGTKKAMLLIDELVLSTQTQA